MNFLIIIGTALLLSASIFGFTSHATKDTLLKKPEPTVQLQQPVAEADNISQAVSYQNTEYGFKFSLPDSWRGYTIVTDKWIGNAVGDAVGSSQAETGPLLSIRHPKWTAKDPRQDIPIMIFTLAQWNALGQDKFHIGAAPVGPRELGRNQAYVFALPARYNFAFLTGFEEVEAILNNHPLTVMPN